MSAPTAATEVFPSPVVVQQLLREQAAHLAHLPVRASSAAGSSNWVFRLGDELAVRLPRSDDYIPDLLNEVRWLPYLAPALTAAPVPEIVTTGAASELFPRPWAVVSWVQGDLPTTLDGEQQDRFARTLGPFLQQLHGIATDGVQSGPENWGYRCGEPVTDTIDEWADHAATALSDLFDPAQIREAWGRLREVPPASQPPCWVHTDVSAENLLVHRDGSLAGVIDFGGVGVGDRSVDLLYAWSLMDAPAREVLRRTSGTDQDTWIRARAWAFVGPGLLTIANYRHTMPERTARLTVMIRRVAADIGIDLH